MKTILVVDDDADIAEALVEFLVGEGYRVVSAGNGNDALTRLEKESPNLVLTDSIMPIVDGPGFVQQVHALPEFRSLPVIPAFSASCSWVTKSASRSARMR